MGQALAYAVGVAVSPLPIVVALLLESGDRGSRPVLAYLLGLAAGTALAAVTAVALVSGLDLTDTPESTDALRVALGAVLLVVGLALLVARKRLGRVQLLDRAAELPPRSAALTGFVLPLVNAKNLPLMVAAAIEVVEVGRPIAGAAMLVAVSLALVVAISAVGLVVPGTHDALRSVRRRLARREIEIAAAICFLLGAKLALDGL